MPSLAAHNIHATCPHPQRAADAAAVAEAAPMAAKGTIHPFVSSEPMANPPNMGAPDAGLLQNVTCKHEDDV